MDQRLESVLEAVIRSYISDGRPVASKHIAASRFSLSSASIRNMMAKLERKGFLYKPHTSAGRIPTDRGYRYYVDWLTGQANLSSREKRTIARAIQRGKTTGALMRNVAQVIGSLSGQICIILSSLRDEKIKTMDLGAASCLEDDGCWIYGRDSIIGRLGSMVETRDLLRVLDNPQELRKAMLGADGGEGILIGRENSAKGMHGCSLVWSCYEAGSARGVIAIVGPKRMEYERMMALVRYASEYLTMYFERKGGM